MTQCLRDLGFAHVSKVGGQKVKSHLLILDIFAHVLPKGGLQQNLDRLFGKASRRNADVQVGKGFPTSPFPAIACPSQYLERA